MKMKKNFQFSYPISDEHFHEYENQFPINIQGLSGNPRNGKCNYLNLTSDTFTLYNTIKIQSFRDFKLYLQSIAPPSPFSPNR